MACAAANALNLELGGVVERLDGGVHVVGEPRLVSQAVVEPRADMPFVEDPRERLQGRVGSGRARKSTCTAWAPRAVHVAVGGGLELAGAPSGSAPRSPRPPRHPGAVDGAGRADRFLGPVRAGEMAPGNVADGEPLHVELGSRNLLPERVGGEGGVSRQVVEVDVAPGLVEVLVNLLEDNLPLHLDLGEGGRPPKVSAMSAIPSPMSSGSREMS